MTLWFYGIWQDY